MPIKVNYISPISVFLLNCLQRMLQKFMIKFAAFFNTAGKEPVFQIGTLVTPTLSLTESSSLECNFSMEEIQKALNQMNPHKASVPDGLNIGFIKTHWKVLRTIIKGFFDDFSHEKPLPKGINSSFISLIPKFKFPREVKDFCPISLINCSLKILLKVLTNRLRLVQDSIISQSQSAFVPGI